MFGQKDNRRADKFARSKKRFANGKHQPRTKKDKSGPRKPTTTIIGRYSRKEYKAIAAETLEILEAGEYNNSDGLTISIEKPLKEAMEKTVTYSPEETPLDFNSSDYAERETHIEVVKNTTLETCWNEFCREPKGARGKAQPSPAQPSPICALNFASAKNPGGGFMKGSNAQEESLCRGSGLYRCINNSEMYDANKEDNKCCLYQEYLIYSPQVPVFRDQNEELLDAPYNVSFLTVPAPNTSQARRHGVSKEEIEKVTAERIDRLLSVAAYHKVDVLILGAWGCGVFGGDIEVIGKNFFELLRNKYNNIFSKVIFAVLSDENFLEKSLIKKA